jgi:hypothetical protein
MTKKLLAASAVLSALVVSALGAPARAGLQGKDVDEYVSIVLGANPNAAGGFGPVRNSTDTVQYIGCDLNASATAQSVYCYAHDSGTTQLACSSTTPSHIAAVKALSSSSFLAFTTDPLGITCTSVVVVNSSIDSPKK